MSLVMCSYKQALRDARYSPQFISDIVTMGRLFPALPGTPSSSYTRSARAVVVSPEAVSKEAVPVSLPLPGCLPAGGTGAAAMQQGWGGP